MPLIHRPVYLLCISFALVMAESGEGSAEGPGENSGRKQTRDMKSDGDTAVVGMVSLNESRLDESSGLAASRRRPGHFWTHNDSDGRPRLFAFDTKGRKTGQITLRSADAVDWEDMASFTQDGTARLLVADCGDNRAERPTIELYILDEPDPTQSSSVVPNCVLTVRYSDGPRNCEAIAVDTKRKQIVLISKTYATPAGVYVLPLPERDSVGSSTVTAKRVATLAMPMVTGMDIDAASGNVWVSSYLQAFCFQCDGRESTIRQQLASTPTPRRLPRWKQIEAVAVDADQEIWITSEGSPALLGRLPSQATPQSK